MSFLGFSIPQATCLFVGVFLFATYACILVCHNDKMRSLEQIQIILQLHYFWLEHLRRALHVSITCAQVWKRNLVCMAYFLSREDPVRPAGKRIAASQLKNGLSSNPVGQSDLSSSPNPRRGEGGYSADIADARQPLRQLQGGYGKAQQRNGNVQHDASAYSQELDKNLHRPPTQGDLVSQGRQSDNITSNAVGRAAPRDVVHGGASGAYSQQEAYAIAANRQRGEACGGGARGNGPSYGGTNGNGGQNTGNMIGNRNSSRVLAPPGGFSSLTLG